MKYNTNTKLITYAFFTSLGGGGGFGRRDQGRDQGGRDQGPMRSGNDRGNDRNRPY